MKSELTRSTHCKAGYHKQNCFLGAGLFQIFRKLIHKEAKTHRKYNKMGKMNLTGSL